jgi:hypothetical protein
MTLQIADCRVKIHGLTIGRLPIGATPRAAGGCAVTRSNQQSEFDNPPIFNLQSSVGNGVWAS